MDNFALLQQPRQPWLDADELKAAFLKLAAQFHPDKAHIDKAAATTLYAELNGAYRCLSEPKERLLHLIELETGARPKDVQNIPPAAMNLFMEVGQACREADQYLTARDKTDSPLLKAQMFEKGLAWTDKLNNLRQRIDAQREELLAELKRVNEAWLAGARPLEQLEQMYRSLGYLNRWGSQIQERLVRLSF